MEKEMAARAEYMSPRDKAAWQAAEERTGYKISRTHQNCIEITGKARPGKTDKEKRSKT